MEYLAGFYIVLGFLIIIFKSEFLKENLYKAFLNKSDKSDGDGQVELRPVYPSVDKMALQKVPVIVRRESPFQRS